MGDAKSPQHSERPEKRPQKSVQRGAFGRMGYFASVMVFIILVSMGSPLYLPLALSVAFNYGVAPALYQYLLDSTSVFGAVFCVCTAVPIITYWVNGLMFLGVDEMVKKWSKQYKLQPAKYIDPFDTKLMRKVVTNLLIGQFCVIVPCAFFYAECSKKGFGFRADPQLPSSAEMFHDYICFVIGNELIFYYGHAALHSKWLYRNVHKIHHEFQAPFALVASYCHPLEMLLSNVLPLTLTGFLMQVHLYTVVVWIVFAVLGTQLHHSGYHWPFIPSWDEQPDFHDFHHEKFTSNFGSIGFLDAIHGTNVEFAAIHAAKAAKAAKGSPDTPASKMPVSIWMVQLGVIMGLALLPVPVLDGLP